MTTKDIEVRLFELQDLKYRDFHSSLMPNVDKEKVIGVRTPLLRSYAKALTKEGAAGSFISELPHRYFEEDQLHGLIISEIKDLDTCMAEVCRFLPYVDNWATCDMLSPKIFRKHRRELLAYISEWIASDRTYTIRFAIGMLMQHFLDEDFDKSYADMVAAVRSDEYYVNMMIAWYFATALAKQYEAILSYIEGRRLEKWTHNKTIQKAVESYRITDEQKVYLRSLRIK